MGGKINVINANKTTKTKIKTESESLISEEHLFRTSSVQEKVHECVCGPLHTNTHICRLGEVIKVYYSGSQQFVFEAPFGLTGHQDLDSG